jgi:predicted TIM-barrel fold metal-dependent hydrolase
MAPIVYDNTLPRGAWDSHVHVVDEVRAGINCRYFMSKLIVAVHKTVFPLHPDHPYRPKKADLNDLLAFEQTTGIEHVCLIAFSVYGTDNTSILDALRRLNGKGRAVVCIDPDEIKDEELCTMHELGVRGVRLNLRTRSEKVDGEVFGKILHKYADRIRPFGWAIQIYTSLDQTALIVPHVPSLGIPVVFDHMASPEGNIVPRKMNGYRELLDLLQQKLAYVKLSGLYRLYETPGLEGYIREILRVAPTQIVWASDWPHSGGVSKNPGGDRNRVQEYRKVSVPDFIANCKRWCDYDEELMYKIWVENPRRLWQYQESD